MSSRREPRPARQEGLLCDEALPGRDVDDHWALDYPGLAQTRPPGRLGKTQCSAGQLTYGTDFYAGLA
jgi:hypothetical protein